MPDNSRRTVRRTLRVLLAVAGLAVALPLVLWGSSSSVEAATLDREAGYTCQYTGLETAVVPSLDGLPLLGSLPVPVLPSTGGSDPVDVAVTVDAPAQVAPGDTIRLRGTASFTFGPNATATNASTVFSFVSDSFGIDVTSGSYQRFLRIEKLTTDRSTVGSSVVEARWSLPDFLVPTVPNGRLTLSVPHDALSTNPVSTSPSSVAFTGLLKTDSDLQPERAVACAFDKGQATELGAIRVVAGSAPTTTPAGTGAPTTPAATVPPPGAGGPPAVDPGAPAASPPPGAPAPEVPVATDGATAPVVAETPALLAAEPIPPATVTDGVHLPAWALLLVGGFAAGGVFVAVSSRRRLRQVAVTAVVLALAGVVPMPLGHDAPAEAAVATAAPVAAASGQAQVTMLCVYEAEGSASNDVPKSQPTGVSISLEVPDAVAPGDVVTLTGSASVQAPEDIRSQGAALGFNQLDAISDSFSVGLTIGSGKRQVFFADRWQTGKTAFSNPLVVRAPLYFQGFKVPDDATGSISLELPRNEVLDRRPKPFQNPDTPPRVAVEFLASASGNGTSITYVVSCWRSDSGSGLIATVPIVPVGAEAPPVDPTTPAPGAPSVPGTTTTQPAVPGTTEPAAPGAPVATSPAPGGPAASGAPGSPVAPAAPGDPTAAAGAPLLQGAASAAAVPAAQDVTVPTWLVLVALLLGGAGYGYAGWNRLRLRAAGTRSDA